MSLIWAAQVAAVARWKADAGVQAMVSDRIYDGQAPSDAVLPYVVVGESTEVPKRTMGSAGGDTTLAAHVWSEYRGTKEALAAAAALTAALAAPLTLAGYGAAHLRLEFMETLVDTAGKKTLRHVPIRYRIVSWPT